MPWIEVSGWALYAEEHPTWNNLTEFDKDAWRFGNRLLERKKFADADLAGESVFEANGDHYAVSELVDKTQRGKPLSEDSPFRPEWESGEECAPHSSWRVGDVVLESQQIREYLHLVGTTEDTTLKWLQDHKFSFETPKVLHSHGAFDRRFIIKTCLSGPTLATAWQTLSQEQKDHFAGRAADIVREVAEYRNDKICGVDGLGFEDYFLSAKSNAFQPEQLALRAKERKMDCSDVVLMLEGACDPSNLVIRPGGALALNEVGLVAYVPRVWIGTKVSLTKVYRWLDSGPSLDEFTDMFLKKLEERGFPHDREVLKATVKIERRENTEFEAKWERREQLYLASLPKDDQKAFF